MRRVRCHENGGPDVLRVEEAEVPEPGAGEVLIRSEAIGVTLPGVRKVREGGMPLPGGFGGEIAGEVCALGPDVTGFAVGDRVVAISFTDAYADFALAPVFTASHIPATVSASRAVALVRGGHVALAALFVAGPVRGRSVLITGAASGVGHLAVQLARLHGASRVVAAVGSADKTAFVRGLGADEAVVYADESWGEPVDVVLDAVGGELLPRALDALAPFGRLVFFNSGGGTVPAYELLAGAKTITGLTMARFSTAYPDTYAEHGDRLWELACSGRLLPVVHETFALADAARAHEVIEARANLGKVVLRP
ncbi:zinc-binding dehydrogenase [Streptomyces sp. SID3343]|uniref:quinone oxidoreductase family protein n=1 Tax=Streptomyces sp. SID3343 TaxID=2690260 RepID=UPI00136B2E1F|nr:zinc-binding dehydrogenase [Streptomyces sp. SID3343]MYV97665.1 zinc-binding dehydrogenase [Streptomyces sp. SID3343]